LPTQDLLSDGAVTIVAKALEAHRDEIGQGALLSIDEGGMGQVFRATRTKQKRQV
jgi:hypothetical protein